MNKRMALAAVALAALSRPAGAADILNYCANDVDAYCSEVTPGYGRVMSCLYAYEDKISDECDRAMADVAAIIDTMFYEVWQVKLDCGEDIRTHCGDVPAGEGQILTCLAENRDKVSESCSATMGSLSLPAE